MADIHRNILCGPLLRYTYIDHKTSVWNGSILVVIQGFERPVLSIRPAVDEAPSPTELLSEHGHSFWRFSIAVPLAEEDLEVSYAFKAAGTQSGSEQGKKECTFWIPAKEETMRLLFHSCNGFSLGVKEGTFAGPVLWKDVLRIHAEQPLHAMIGGGDQVYSDGVRTLGPLKGGASNPSPRKRAKMPVTPQLGKELDEWYFNNYCGWYSSEPFSAAAASIPSVQIFDDHDIIDGYGSYPDRWMQAPAFLEIGRVAWKYYMLFQQHTLPQGEVLGTERGPYIQELSRSICTTFGKRVVFFGLDGHVDRTLERICYPSTYEAMFARLEKEVVYGQTKHLILLLGVPIAYPRLVWLENLLSAHTVTVLRWFNKISGIAAGMFNKFDGSAELLDDLNDHWCAGMHKTERNAFVKRLKEFSRTKHVRITILSGDVHLACVGRFFSKASLGIPQNKDHRYMVNIVSSAITNAPPPAAVANMLNKRNKLHHLDEDTDENLMPIFYQNPDGKINTVNRTTLPSRNYCIITEHAGLTGVGTGANGHADVAIDEHKEGVPSASLVEAKQGREGANTGDMIVAREQCGSVDHPSAAAPQNGTTRRYALDISIRAEIDPKDPEGRTTAYGFSIPFLEA
ncbi:hypothetical protein DFH11DRAFT_1627141 [Phellopilus nigrolimitatus]|nr:hypothetical protein DFH11DRAFT_1627141 [Phellopilus nigrolimitatus]